VICQPPKFRGNRLICTPPQAYIHEVTRAREIGSTIDTIGRVGFTRAESRAIVAVLVEGKTHREAAAAIGQTRQASKKRLSRARHRARPHGIIIPSPRRTFVVTTLAEITARN
jgi:hypothetical protein